MARLPGLQALRALAALMVLVGHTLAEAGHYFAVALPGAGLPWSRGVDIFFVISGFIVALSAARFAGRPGAFLRRRALRVVPLYWLFTTLAVVAALAGGTKETGVDAGQIASSYLFLPYERADGRIAPVLSPGWTLNYEMLFYALLAAALMTRAPLRAAALALCGLVAAGLVLRPGGTAAVFATNPLILEFLFGMGLARAWAAGWRRPDAALALGLVAGGVAGLVLLDGTALPRVVAAGLPAALIVAGGTLACPDRPIPGQALGDASYALYLSHRFALRSLTLLVLPVLPGGGAGAWVYAALATAAAIWVGLLVHRHVERPLLAALSPARGAAA